MRTPLRLKVQEKFRKRQIHRQKQFRSLQQRRMRLLMLPLQRMRSRRQIHRMHLRRWTTRQKWQLHRMLISQKALLWSGR